MFSLSRILETPFRHRARPRLLVELSKLVTRLCLALLISETLFRQGACLLVERLADVARNGALLVLRGVKKINENEFADSGSSWGFPGFWPQAALLVLRGVQLKMKMISRFEARFPGFWPQAALLVLRGLVEAPRISCF